MKDPLVHHPHQPDLNSDNTLHVISVLSNPARWHSRYRIFHHWMKAMGKTPNVALHIVESAYGDRKHELTQATNFNHLQVRTHSELWNKENLINLGVRHLLPRDWKYMAWVDGDVFFQDESWALETLHELQHFAVVQPWQTCLDLGPRGHGMNLFKSFGYVHELGIPKQKNASEPYTYGHTGYAWACRRDFYENVGGLIDFAILGSADHHMAWAMIGDVNHTVPKGLEDYLRLCQDWQKKALKITNGEVGFTHGRIEHVFHGSKNKRYYRSRWQILIDNHFTPSQDLIYDSQGVLYLKGKPELEQAIRKYNRSRCEDGIEE